MKIAAIVTAAALATGTAAFAADYGTTSDRDTTNHPAVTQNSDSHATHEGLLSKTKRAFHRMGDKIRGAGHHMARVTHTDGDRTAMSHRDDTRSMGAAGDDTHDSARQRRMDDAYGSWHRKHGDDKR